MRYLGLDYGRKRIGLALSDPLGISAQPLETILHKSDIFEKLKALIEEREVDEIVIGYPRSMDGTAGPMAHEVEAFAEKLRNCQSCPVHLSDERLTTAEAERLLIHADVRRAKRKEVRDKVAAVLILQGFLRTKENS